MNSWTRWLRSDRGLAAAFVAVSRCHTGDQARELGADHHGGPWFPAVIVAAWPGTYRRCLPRRTGQAG